MTALQVEQDRMRLSEYSEMSIRLETIGQARYPLVIVDNFYREPDYVFAMAHSLQYSPPSTRHTHARAEVTVDTSEIEQFVYDQLAHDWGVDPNAVFRTKDTDLGIFHRSVRSDEFHRYTRRSAPHVDGGTLLASVVYLTESSHNFGGTGFFRHRPTGFEACFADFGPGGAADAGHHQEFGARIERSGVFDAFIASGRDPASYHDFWERTLASYPFVNHLIDGNETWECTKLAEMRFNRCVIYPSFVLHKPVIDYKWFDDDDVRGRRLTQNFWVRLPNGE